MAITTARVALAHSELIRSEPKDGQVLGEPPEVVKAWFSEELDSISSKMGVFDSQSQQVDNKDGGVDLNDMEHTSMVVSLPSTLPDGAYTIRWTAASAEDGDLTEGAFNFMVGSSSDIPGSAVQSPIGGLGPIIVGIAAGLLLLVIVLFVISRRRLSTE
jgi:methionine-rich copper-binding protein CopC